MSSSDAVTSHEWLPMPSGISLSPHNSFSRELLRQFDKRRSQLHFDSISIQHKDEIIPSDKCSIVSNSNSNHSRVVASLLLDTTSMSASSISLENTNDLQSLEDAEDEEERERGGRGTKEQERSVVLTLNDNTTTPNNTTRRSKSAGNLLRKSSVYLKNKFNHHHHLPTIDKQHTTTTNTNNNVNIPPSSTNTTLFNSIKKKKKSYKAAQDIFQVPNNTNQPQEQQTQHLSKIAINTTINIGSINTSNYHPLIDLNNSNHIIQPPIITQYPPKPLKYSPVEPLPDEYEHAGNIDSNHVINSNSKSRKALHRLSLPLLKLTAASQSQGGIERREINRRRSDSDLLNQEHPQQQQQLSTHTSLLHSLSKQWNKLICTCKSKKYSTKKEKVRSTD